MHQRNPLVEGILYPESAEELSTLITSTLETRQERDSPSWPMVLLTPHGGYHHLARVLGIGYSRVRSAGPDRIVILAPLHREPLREHSGTHLFFPSAESFAVPNGVVPIDRNWVTTLCERLAATYGDAGAPIIFDGYFDEEPAIEVQLPYITELFPDLPVIPVLVGGRGSKTAQAVTALIRELPKEGTLVIITSNLTDYLPPQIAQGHAQTACDILAGSDRTPLLEADHRHMISMCGTTILAGLYKYLPKEGYRFEILGQCTSSPEAPYITQYVSGIFLPDDRSDTP